jgi:hypothetical protein
MAFKYAVEAAVIAKYTSSVFWPTDFLNPVLSSRQAILGPAPEWVVWALFTWTLPFLWIAISMSVRRASDAGISPWWGMVVLVPLVNLLFMLTMCWLPSQPGSGWARTPGPVSESGRAKSAALAVGASLLLGGTMLLVSVYLFSTYGASLFLGTPLLMGATAAYLYNRAHSRGYLESVVVGTAAVFFAGLALLLFALEGVLCVAMAAPLLLPLGAFGGLLGKAMADSTRRPSVGVLAATVVLPVLAGIESLRVSRSEFEVVTAVDIAAPAEVVWANVIRFPDLPDPVEWYFRAGIACPTRARIDGFGVGATRYCEFTTGTFVEPITIWDRPHRLAFDVTDQPAPLFELSPYQHVHAPHLDGYLRSDRGEFLLLPLPGGHTRLEGRTWYQLQMFPHWYWTLWSDLLIHRIHQRVLSHIQRLSERSANGD